MIFRKKDVLCTAMIGSLILIPFSLSARPSSDEGFRVARRDSAKGGSLMDQLRLTPQQQETLMKRREEQRGIRQEMRRQLQEKRAALQEEIGRTQSDAAKIGRLTQDIKALQSRQLDEKVEELMELKRVLTPQQYQKFQEKVREVKSQRRRHE